MDEITVDRQTLKALGAETRIAILKNLLRKRMTQAELANELGIAAPSVNEHLRQLQNANLIVVEESNRKWKYYSLTTKGTAIIEPSTKRVWFLLSISLIALVISLANIYPYFNSQPMDSSIMDARTAPAIIDANSALDANNELTSIAASPASSQLPLSNAKTTAVPESLQALPLHFIAISLVALLLIGYSAGILIKRD